ncbi:acyl-CoA thioesterase [Peribacillus psychrosaccharolyticus]|uniref:Acyl-CoA thioesterase n=1 Tax=Peribacillus psychrosaccharolyticus TaxID=1407 RepID=A0A974S2C2_PERPY|nr:thioesterase family protein [Peribacillus psychrosaccharolyticus]MEC2054192.1 thioesterase family protein [Peribacillus psychrosaccharolyticus]MED3742190.1 thioesterase family protein [Peribacillus psychrosaccharolyticus]QQT01180.1 acyl-CoA thioesterase [Peribacillus psychrosaccharolyticus]
MNTSLAIKIQETDIDEIGHVNYMNYISFSERGMGDWYKKAGVPLTDLLEKNVGTVLLKFDILYLAEARVGDTLTIHTIPVRLGTKSFEFKQEIYNQDGIQTTECNKTFVMFDLITRKSIPVEPNIVSHFD